MLRKPLRIWHGYVYEVGRRTMWLELKRVGGPDIGIEVKRSALHGAEEGQYVRVLAKGRARVVDDSPPPWTAKQLDEVRRRAREWVASMAGNWLMPETDAAIPAQLPAVIVSDAIPPGEILIVAEHVEPGGKVTYSGVKLINVGDTRPPEFCATCGHQVIPLTARCGWGRDSQGRPHCHPNEPGHPDCYTLATRTFGRKPTYGKCTACGAVEVALNRPHGTVAIEGESDHYPVGYGCELCD